MQWAHVQFLVEVPYLAFRAPNRNPGELQTALLCCSVSLWGFCLWNSGFRLLLVACWGLMVACGDYPVLWYYQCPQTWDAASAKTVEILWWVGSSTCAEGLQPQSSEVAVVVMNASSVSWQGSGDPKDSLPLQPHVLVDRPGWRVQVRNWNHA